MSQQDQTFVPNTPPSQQGLSPDVFLPPPLPDSDNDSPFASQEFKIRLDSPPPVAIAKPNKAARKAAKRKVKVEEEVRVKAEEPRVEGPPPLHSAHLARRATETPKTKKPTFSWLFPKPTRLSLVKTEAPTEVKPLPPPIPKRVRKSVIKEEDDGLMFVVSSDSEEEKDSVLKPVEGISNNNPLPTDEMYVHKITPVTRYTC